MIAPKLKNYDINILVALGNNEPNDIKRNQIKLTIVEKILENNCSIFFLVNSFILTNKILKECYAEVITILMKESLYLIDEDVIIQIVSFASLDVLSNYGSQSKNELFSSKCVEEFWKRADSIEDKKMLKDKKHYGRIKSIFNIKKKGDRI